MREQASIRPKSQPAEPSSPWHAISAEQVLVHLSAGTSGLSTAEARQRLAVWGPNALAATRPMSIGALLLEQLKSVVVLLLVIAAGVALLSGDALDAAAIGVVLVLNTTIGFATEYRARRAIAALLALEVPRATVVRDGVRRELSARELVPGDLIELVNRTTHTIEKNLLLGGTFVIVLLWLFLRNVAASLIVAAVIPLSMLWAFVAMRWFGYSANLMSLGALDFGLLVDGSVVMIENIMRRSSGPADADAAQRLERLRRSAIEVGRPTVFGIAIIVAVYLPLFALQGVERKMFVPMAFTVVAALLGSLLIALTVVPAAARTFLGNAHEPHSERFERIKQAYSRLLVTTFRRRRLLAAGGLLVIATTVFAATRLGVEFMPRLDEGSVLVQARRLPSTALGEGSHVSLEIERALRGRPEVRTT